MSIRKHLILTLAITAALAACSKPAEQASAPAAAETPAPAATEAPATTGTPAAASAGQAIAAAIAGAHRSAENKARDPWRRPAETLAFFGVQPTSTVVEITPGGGWYTEILGPALANGGKLLAAVVDPASASERSRDYYTRAADAYGAKLAADPELYGSTEIVSFSLESPSFGPDGSADVVVTFRNVHNWVGSGAAPKMFEGFFKVLKPGGVLGVVEHSVKAGSAGDKPDSGYMTEEAVVKLATDAGFELAERSDINANLADTGDHPNGVWNLPPSLRVADGDDAGKYQAIGESNRMTLKFVKPLGDVIHRQGMDKADGSSD